MNRLKGILSVVLSVLLFIGIFPADVFAGETASIEIVFETDFFESGSTVVAKVYVPEGIAFGTVGYSIKYNAGNAEYADGEEGINLNVARTKSGEGYVARSLYTSAGKNPQAEDGKVLIDTITFTMLKTGRIDAEYYVLENDADFGRKSTFMVNKGSYYDVAEIITYVTPYEVILAAAGEDALKEISGYKNPEEYRYSQSIKIAHIIVNAKTSIENALTVSEIAQIVAVAKAELDALKTDAQLSAEEAAKALEEAKASAKAEIAEYKNAEDYREAEKEFLAQEIAEAVSAIEEAKTVEDVRKALEEAKAEIDVIKTDSEYKAEEDAEGITGDVNNDGKVNALDATQILRYANNKPSVLADAEEGTALFNVADVNGDGKVNALDATQILRYANNKPSVIDGK